MKVFLRRAWTVLFFAAFMYALAAVWWWGT